MCGIRAAPLQRLSWQSARCFWGALTLEIVGVQNDETRACSIEQTRVPSSGRIVEDPYVFTRSREVRSFERFDCLCSTLREQCAKFSGTTEADAACDVTFIHAFSQVFASLLGANFVVKHVRRSAESRAELTRKVELGQIQIERHFIRTHALTIFGSCTNPIPGNEHTLRRGARNRVCRGSPSRNLRNRLRDGSIVARGKRWHPQSGCRRGVIGLGGCRYHRQRKCFTHGNLSSVTGLVRLIAAP